MLAAGAGSDWNGSPVQQTPVTAGVQGLPEKAPCTPLSGTGVCCAGYNGKRSRQHKKPENCIVAESIYLWATKLFQRMNDALKNLFKSLAPFTDEDFAEADRYFKTETLKKGDFFSKAGRISDRLGFVNSGLLRSFYTIKGKETTTFFQMPGSIAAALMSFLQMKPAIENIQALEDSELVVISRKELLNLYNENWKWQQVGRVITERYYVKMEERTISLQSQSAQERYENFLLEFPELIQVVPLYYIASFLGISPETLSRIRKNR